MRCERGAILLEAVFALEVISILLSFQIQLLRAEISRLEGLQEKRIVYDGVPLWKKQILSDF